MTGCIQEHKSRVKYGLKGRHGKTGRAILLLWVLYFYFVHRYSMVKGMHLVLTSHQTGLTSAPVCIHSAREHTLLWSEYRHMRLCKGQKHTHPGTPVHRRLCRLFSSRREDTFRPFKFSSTGCIHFCYLMDESKVEKLVTGVMGSLDIFDLFLSPSATALSTRVRRRT